MKLSISQSTLSALLSQVGRIVPSRPSHPILANIRLVAEPKKLTATAFDLSIGLTVSVEADVKEAGDVCVPASLLAGIVAKLPEGDVTLALDGTTLAVKGKKGKYTVSCLPPDEFPSLPVSEGESFRLPAELLLSAINATAYACSDDQTKAVLNGVRFTASRDAIEVVATNGHILALWGTSEFGAIEDVAATIPSAAANELSRLIIAETARRKRAKDESLVEVELSIDDSQAVFWVGESKLTSRLIEGQYPNCQQLIPKKFSKLLTVDRSELLDAVERIAVIAAEKNNVVKLALSEVVSLSAAAADVGDGNEELLGAYEGEALEIAFSCRYMVDALKSIDALEVQLSFNTATSPFVIARVGEKPSALLMPIQIRE